MPNLDDIIMAPGLLADRPAALVRGRLYFATDTGLMYRDNGSSWVAMPFYESYAQICEQQASGTAGGGFTSGSYVTRVLNTEVFDPDGIVSLSSNQFTLAAGTYRILALCPAHQVDRHKAKLYNVTDAADQIIGHSAYSSNAYVGNSVSVVKGMFEIIATKVFEIRHRCETTKATNGLGVACSFGDVEIHSSVEIWRRFP